MLFNKALAGIVFLISLNLFAEEVFYYSCDSESTTFSIVKTNEKCNVGFCEMGSLCKTNKGEMYVSHLCQSLSDGSCPTMIDCLDDTSIDIKPALNIQNSNQFNKLPNGITK